MNKEIKRFFYHQKVKQIRKVIVPGNSKTLWDAVKKAKDINVNHLPEFLYENNKVIPPNDEVNAFANFFFNKVKNITNTTQIAPGVYNGLNKVTCTDEFFMTSKDITECLRSIKIKKLRRL